MHSLIELMDAIAALPSLDRDVRERARHLGWSFSQQSANPRGIYHWLLRGR